MSCLSAFKTADNSNLGSSCLTPYLMRSLIASCKFSLSFLSSSRMLFKNMLYGSIYSVRPGEYSDLLSLLSLTDNIITLRGDGVGELFWTTYFCCWALSFLSYSKGLSRGHKASSCLSCRLTSDYCSLLLGTFVRRAACCMARMRILIPSSFTLSR